MASTERPLTRGLPPMHPGELLSEDILPALKAEGIGKGEVAERIGISRTMFEKLTKCQSAVTPEMALRLGRFFGNTPEFWMNLQTAWDLWQARDRIGDQLAAIQPAPRPRASAA